MRKIAVMLVALALAVGVGAGAQAPQPDPWDPPCESHDDTQTHQLWDAVGDCHYDHSHGATQAELEAFFEKWGLPVDRVQESPLALSVQTPRENERKHSGYRWTLYEVEDGCHKDDKGLVDKNGRNDNCIVAFASRVHDLGGPPEVTTKLHSLALYTVACRDSNPDPLVDGPPDLSQCGWSYTEQAAQFGPEHQHEVHSPYKQGFAVGFEGNGSFDPPYVGARTLAQCVTRAKYDKECIETWNSERAGAADGPRLTNFDYRTYDAPQGIDPFQPLYEQPLGGKYNNSERHVYVVIMVVPGEGMVTGSGSAQLCDYAADAPCAPTGAWQLHNYPAGWSVYLRTLSGSVIQQVPLNATVQDVDVYFNGQPSGWLKVHAPLP